MLLNLFLSRNWYSPEHSTGILSFWAVKDIKNYKNCKWSGKFRGSRRGWKKIVGEVRSGRKDRQRQDMNKTNTFYGLGWYCAFPKGYWFLTYNWWHALDTCAPVGVLFPVFMYMLGLILWQGQEANWGWKVLTRPDVWASLQHHHIILFLSSALSLAAIFFAPKSSHCTNNVFSFYWTIRIRKF